MQGAVLSRHEGEFGSRRIKTETTNCVKQVQ